MITYFSNRSFPQLYIDWFRKHHFAKATSIDNAQWVLLKTRGMNKRLLTETCRTCEVIVGFPHSFQLAAKNLLWLNLKREYDQEADSICPITYLPDEPYLKAQLTKHLEAGERIILKTNYQRRKGIHLVESKEELAKVNLRNYAVAQVVIDDLLRYHGHAFNLRIYLAVAGDERDVFFYTFPIGKMIYSDKSLELITSNKKHPSGFPLHTNNDAAIETIGIDGFKKCTQLISKAVKAHREHFLRNLRPDIHYYDLFGVDVIFRKNHDPMILEFNRSPGLSWVNEEDWILKKEMLNSFLNMALMKSHSPQGWIQV